jgi:hypothetical protein
VEGGHSYQVGREGFEEDVGLNLVQKGLASSDHASFSGRSKGAGGEFLVELMEVTDSNRCKFLIGREKK